MYRIQQQFHLLIFANPILSPPISPFGDLIISQNGYSVNSNFDFFIAIGDGLGYNTINRG